MIKFTPLYCKITKNKTFKKLSVETRLGFIYLLADESLTLTGIFNIDPEIFSLKMNCGKKIVEILKELSDNDFIKYDKKEGVVWIIKRFQLIPTKSPKIIRGIINELDLIDHPFKVEFEKKYYDYLKPYLVTSREYKKEENILTIEQVQNFSKINWGKERIYKFYKDHGYKECDIASIVEHVLK